MMKTPSSRAILSTSHLRLLSSPPTHHSLSRPRQSPAWINHRQVHTRGRAENSSLAFQQSSNTAEPSTSTPVYPRSDTHAAVETDKLSSPLQYYRELIDSGALRGDDHQTKIIQKLQDLHDQLKTYNPPPIPFPSSSNNFLSRIFSRDVSDIIIPPDQVPRGLYLYGDVGTGKTMLMDLFYKTLPPSIKRKRRVHFHAFMIEVHKRVHAVNISRGYNGGDQILPVARDLANDAIVLCFDEFQVTDITDAMILKRLIESLLNLGVVCVFTSNRHPDDLYKNGIQRSSFLPTIELLKTRYDVTDLDSGTDYRRIPRALSQVYYDPLSHENQQEIDKIFRSMTSDDPSDPVIKNRPLKFWGRTLHVPESTSKVAKFTFKDLCQKPLSAADYLEVTKTFGTVFVTEVPKMGWNDKDMARRFINFIDACYESKTKLFVTSEVPIFKIFSDEPSDTSSRPISHHMRSVMDDLGLSSEIVGTSSLFTIDEEIFAFARACSRLVQMGSKEWAETAGLHDS